MKLEENKHDDYERSTFLQILAEIIVPGLNNSPISSKFALNSDSLAETKDIINTICW